MNPLEFEHKYVSRDCVVGQQVVMLHSILYHSGVRGDALAMAEHNLHAIVVATTSPYARLRPERLSEGTHDLAGVIDMRIDPAFDPQAMKRQVVAAFSGMRNALSKMTKQPVDGLNERVALRKYRATIAAEREIGLTFVRQEVARVRKELGL